MDNPTAAYLTSTSFKKPVNMAQTFPKFTFPILHLETPIKRDIISSQWFQPPGFISGEEEVSGPYGYVEERKPEFQGFFSPRSETKTSSSSESYEVISRKDYYPGLSPLPRPEILSQASLKQPEIITQDEDTVLINHPTAESFETSEENSSTVQQGPEPLFFPSLHQRERVYSLSHAVADLRDLPWHVDCTSCTNHDDTKQSPSIHSATSQEKDFLQPNESSQSLLQLIKQQITKLRPGQNKKKGLAENKAETALRLDPTRAEPLAEDSLNTSLEHLTMESKAETLSLAESWLNVCVVPALEEGVRVCDGVAA